MKLTITHEIDRSESKVVKSVSSFWPMVLSNLKWILEMGEVVLTELR